MMCEICHVRLKIVHTYVAGNAAKTSTARCPQCGKKYTAVTVLVGSEPGAAAWAKKIKNACLSGKNGISCIVDSEDSDGKSKN